MQPKDTHIFSAYVTDDYLSLVATDKTLNWAMYPSTLTTCLIYILYLVHYAESPKELLNSPRGNRCKNIKLCPPEV